VIQQPDASEPASAEEPGPVVLDIAEHKEVEEPVAESSEAAPPETSATPADDPWAVPTKKSKKDKKKKKGKDKSPEPEPETEMPVVPEPVPVPDVEGDTSVPEPRVVEDTQPIDELQAAKEAPEVVQSEVHPEEVTETVLPETQPELQPEEAQDVPTKKSKKDKKKKGKNKVAEAEPEPQAEPESPSTSSPVEPESSEPKETVADAIEDGSSSQVVPDPVPEFSGVPQQLQLEETPQEGAEETWAAPTKKGKKDKKKKGKGSKAVEPEPEPEAEAPPEPASEPDPELAPEPAVESAAEPAPELELPVSTQEIAFDPTATEEPTPVPIEVHVPSVEEPVPEPVLETPDALQQQELESTRQDKSEDLWAAPVAKKGKKDKKKGKGKIAELMSLFESGSAAADEPVLESEREVAPEPPSEPAPQPEMMVIAQPAIAESTESEIPALATIEQGPASSIQEPSQAPTAEPAGNQPEELNLAPEQQAEETGGLPGKKGKKVKKGKKNKAAEHEPEPARELTSDPAPEPTSELVSVPTPEPEQPGAESDAAIVPVVPEEAPGSAYHDQVQEAVPEPTDDQPKDLDATPVEQPEQTWDVPAKKGKKSKKGKKNKAAEPDPEPEPALELTPAPETVPERAPETALDPEPSSVPEQVIIERDPSAISIPEESNQEQTQEAIPEPTDVPPTGTDATPEQQPEETWSAPTKKGKKDKKKKGKGKVSSPEPEIETGPSSEPSSEPTPEPEHSAAPEELATDVEIPAVAAEAIPIPQESSQEPNPDSTDAQPRELETAADPQQQPEESGDVLVKKGKKDKKKGKSKTAAPEPEPEPTAPPIAEAPVTEELTAPATLEPETSVPLQIPVEPTVEAALVPDTEGGLELTVEPTTEASAEVVKESTGESVVEPTVEPAVEPVIEAASEPIIEAITEAATEPTTETSQEAAAQEAAIKAVTETVPEPAVEPVIEPVTEVAPEPVIEAVTEAGPEPPVEPIAEPTSESAAEAASDPIAEPTTEVSQEAQEDTWALPTKKSKKDKKRKGSKQATSEPVPEVEAISQPENEIVKEPAAEPDVTQDSVAHDAPTETPSQEATADDLWAEPTKKSKKGKKKGKQAALGLEIDAPTAASQEVLDVHEPRDVSLDEDEAVFGGPSREGSEPSPVKEAEEPEIEAPVAIDEVPVPELAQIEESPAEVAAPIVLEETQIPPEPAPVGQTPAPEPVHVEEQLAEVVAPTILEEAPAAPEPVQAEETAVLEPVHVEQTVSTSDAPQPEEPATRQVVEEPTGVPVVIDAAVADARPDEPLKEEEVVEFTGKKSKKDKNKKGKKTDSMGTSGADTPQDKEMSAAEVLPAAALATAVAVGGAAFIGNETTTPHEAAEEDFAFSTKKSKKLKKRKGKGEVAAVEDEPVISSPAEEPSREIQEAPAEVEKQPGVLEVMHPAPTEQRDDLPETENKPSSRPPSPVPDKIEIHPAVSESVRQSPAIGPATAPTTIGLGLIPDPPEPYPEDAPSPKLLTALETPPMSLDAQVQEATRQLGGGVDMTPAQDSSSVAHEPPFDYDAHRKKVKTRELEKTEIAEPVVTAREVEACLAGEDGNEKITGSGVAEIGKDGEGDGKTGEKEDGDDDAALAAAAGALTGGVSLLAEKFGGGKKKGKEKEIVEEMPRNVPAERNLDVEAVDRGFGPTKMEVDQAESTSVEKAMEHSFEPANMEDTAGRSVDVEESTRGRDRRSKTRSLEEPGLGRMDSETIPRAVRDGTAAAEPSTKKRKEQRERSPSPQPVQRAFSFPDDIADEEVFTTRDSEPDNKKQAETTADAPVRLPPISSFSEFMRSQTSLAPVEEELSDEEPVKQQSPQSPTRRSRRIPEAPEVLRDSGISSGSPHPARRIRDDHAEAIRDSGVHLRDSMEGMTPVRESHRSLSPRIPEERLRVQTPHNDDADRRLRRSPLSGHRTGGVVGPETPRLYEPSPPPRTPEPEKLHVSKKRATAAAPAASTPANKHTGAAAGLAAASVASLRSVSDSTPHPPRPADPTPRRVSSNTSVARLRTPEPPAAALRPDSPGTLSLRSYTGTPPLQLRRMDKRASGDLRSVSLSQRDLAAKAREHEKSGTGTSSSSSAAAAAGIAAVGAAALGAAALLSSPLPATAAAANTSTPVANEGRVRAKDMTDVYVCFLSFSFFHFLCYSQLNTDNPRMATARAASARRGRRPARTACVAARACRCWSSSPASSSSSQRTACSSRPAPRPSRPTPTAASPLSLSASPRSSRSSACSRRPTRSSTG
jgi:hypothetical protein